MLPSRRAKGGGRKAEGQGFAVERSETLLQRSCGSTLKSVRTPVDRTLRVLSVSAFHASTLETGLSFPSESLYVPKSPSQSDLLWGAFRLSPYKSL